MGEFQHHIWPSWQCWQPPQSLQSLQHYTPSLSNTHTPNLELPLALSCQQPYQNQYKLSCQNFRFNDLVLVAAGVMLAGGGSQTRSCSCISDVTNRSNLLRSERVRLSSSPENINNSNMAQISDLRSLTLYPREPL